MSNLDFSSKHSRPVQDTFKKYLDTNTFSKKYLDIDTLRKKYLATDTFWDTLRKKYLDTDTFEILSQKSI